MAAKKNLLLERLYGAGETRPFAGLTQNQSALRDSETQAAREHMARAGVKNTVFMSDQEVRDHYFSKPKTHWDAQEVHHTTGSEYRYYSMHPANAEGLINDLRNSGHKFQIKSKTTHASTHGVKIGGSHNYDNDRNDVRAHPRLEIAVKAPAAFHDEMLEKHQQHLVYEGKTWDSFFKEALNSVTVAGVDGIPRTTPVKNEDDQLDNNDPAIYNGLLPDAADTLNKIFDADTQARLKAVYGPNWHQLVSQSLASIPILQPGNRTVNENFHGATMKDHTDFIKNAGTLLHWYAENRAEGMSHEDAKANVLNDRGPHQGNKALTDHFHKLTNAMAGINESFSVITESLASAMNYVNTVGHGNSNPRMKSSMAWFDGVEHLYGVGVAKQARDLSETQGHKAALDFVRDAAKKAGDPKTVEMSAGATPHHGRLNDGPYSQLHAVHLTEDFRPGLLNPGGLFGRQGDEVYTKHHGNFSTDYHRIGPYGDASKGVPEDLLYTDPHIKTLTTHLDGLKAAGKIQGYKWEHYVDDDSRSRARLKVTATHAAQKSLAGGDLSLNRALHNASQAKYADRDAFLNNRLEADKAPNSTNNKPLSVTSQDRAVHRILKDNPDATDEEVGKAWDDHVSAGTVQSHEVPRLVVRYRSRVAYHQGKGNLPE